ncbi:MAG: diacylglycerol kinase family protein [Thermoanaerobaculum sp.]|nr:diacylglycerol kinase family protein [Thermoanaerobaculum sp.]
MNPLPLIFNPAARGGRGKVPRQALAAAAQEFGFRLEFWPTEKPGHATQLAARAQEQGLPAVLVWGGDGTYNEVARGLLNGDTAMLPLPGGTTSVLVYELGLPRDPLQALRVQLAGKKRRFFVGRTDRGQVFLLMLSAGPDSLILYNLPQFLKRHAGKVGITLQAVREFFRARLPSFQVACDGQVLSAGWCIVGNGRFYGGPFAATPGASPFSPGLEAVIQTRHGRPAALPFFFAIPFGAHLRQKGVVRLATDEVRLESSGRVPYQLDGDPAGWLPVTARASEDWLPVWLPG